jgi:hypothetical protein
MESLCSRFARLRLNLYTTRRPTGLKILNILEVLLQPYSGVKQSFNTGGPQAMKMRLVYGYRSQHA